MEVIIPGKYNHAVGPRIREAVTRLCCIAALQRHIFGGRADVRAILLRNSFTYTSFYTLPCQFIIDTMSGAEVVLGVVAGGAGLMSLSIQLAESAVKLKRFYHSMRNAPEALNSTADEIQIMSLSLRLIIRHWQTEMQPADILDRCIENCRRHVTGIEELVSKLSQKLDRGSLSGKLYAAIREQDLDKLLNDLDRARDALHLVVQIYHQEEQTHRWLEQQNNATTWNLQLATMQRALQTRVEKLKHQLNQIVQHTRSHRIQAAEEVSPRLISSNQLEESTQIVSNPAGRRRSCNSRNAAFRVRLRVPTWFSTRVWEIAKVDAQQGWDLHFRAYNQRPDNAPILVCCDDGNFHETRRLIEAREAALLNVTTSGDNLLSIALRGFSDDEIILQDEESGNTYDRHGLVKWLLEQGMSLDETNGSAALYACCSHPCADPETCGLIVRPVIDDIHAMLGYRAIQWLWAHCVKSGSLDFLIHRLHLSVYERAQLGVDLFDTSDSAATYMAKLRLSAFDSGLTYSGLKDNRSPLHYVARFLGCDLLDVDRESWIRIGVAVIRDGADLHAVQRDKTVPCTPMLQLLREFVPNPARYPHRLPVGVFLGRLDAWTRMLTAAQINLEEYFAAERKVWEEHRLRIRFTTGLRRAYSTNLVRVGFSTETQSCTIHVRNEARIQIAQLHHLPGSFQLRRTDVPDRICWVPTAKEREEGNWSISASKGRVLRSKVVVGYDLATTYAESYYGLLNTTQDDNGTLMRVLRMSHRDRSSRGRSSSQPVPQRRRLLDYENRSISLVHRWLPRHHYCHARSTWVVSGHHTPTMSVPPEPDSSFVDPINCAKDNFSPYDAFEITKQQTPGGFLRDIINCRAGNFVPRADAPYTVPPQLRHNYFSVESGAGTTCPQGCSKVNPDKLEKAFHLPDWHPGYLASRVGTEKAISTVAASQVSGLWERLV
jgi:hypothetical protein